VYGTDPPSRLTIARIRDKFELHGTVCDVHKGPSGRPRTATSDESSAAALERFHSSPQKSIRQCARESGVSAISVLSVLRILKKELRGFESTSELYRLSDRRRSAKLVPTLADRGYHVVSATSPSVRNFDFLNLESLLFLPSKVK
jgi:hypothetical protein